MKINKVINNNIVSSFDESGREVIIMGRGIGFGSRVGNTIEDTKIEKVFRMDSKDQTRQLQDLLNDVPLERVQVVNKIIQVAGKRIKDEMQRSIYITLIDHINFAIERQKQNIEFHNPMLCDIKRFYPQEYELGLESVKYINEKLKVSLPKDEAASIALHFINAEMGKGMPATIGITKIIQNSIKIIKYHYGMELDENSLNYERFITHIKFLAARIVGNEIFESVDTSLNAMVRQQYTDAYQCAERIGEYIKKEFGNDITLDELTYLTLHIERITKKKDIQ